MSDDTNATVVRCGVCIIVHEHGIVRKWSSCRQVGSKVYRTGHVFGSWNDADLSGEVSLCPSPFLINPYLQYIEPLFQALVVSLEKWV